ncbi:MAG: hypothetical protein C0467_27085 [Planctomycetaceae bacterium]|nr:hypothetical protein [Planctomycetaceae bacterium]
MTIRCATGNRPVYAAKFIRSVFGNGCDQNSVRHTHCFGCGKNWNNLDLLLACDYNFADAVALLELWLHLHQTKRSTLATTAPK